MKCINNIEGRYIYFNWHKYNTHTNFHDFQVMSASHLTENISKLSCSVVTAYITNFIRLVQCLRRSIYTNLTFINVYDFQRKLD